MTPTSAPPGPGSLLDRAPTSAPEWTDVAEPDAGLRRDDIIAILKAEMQAPLLALQALRTTMAEGGLSPDLDQRMGQHTKTLARRLSLLLEDLVLVSTRDQGRLVLELQDLCLSTQVTRVASLFPGQSVQVDGDPDVRVRADSLRLQQLLANLIRSAAREQAQPVRLQVSCEDDTVVLSLPGAKTAAGYELGIARQLVLAHGGRVGHHRDVDALLVTLPMARPSRR
jgi:signal transduction histidine kinase